MQANNLTNTTNKYFTPDIEDIRVGYEYEYNTPTGWHKAKVEDLYTDRDGNGISELHWKEIRVPYLTKEQIEAEGWKYNRTYGNDIYGIHIEFKKDQYYLTFCGSHELPHIEIHNGEQYDDLITWYQGICKDINTFRYISKLLRL